MVWLLCLVTQSLSALYICNSVSLCISVSPSCHWAPVAQCLTDLTLAHLAPSRPLLAAGQPVTGYTYSCPGNCWLLAAFSPVSTLSSYSQHWITSLSVFLSWSVKGQTIIWEVNGKKSKWRRTGKHACTMHMSSAHQQLNWNSIAGLGLVNIS